MPLYDLKIDVNDIPVSLAKIQRYLRWFTDCLDHFNVKRLYTEYCNIQSENGETKIDGPLLLMYDKQNPPVLRRKIGYDPNSTKFVDEWYNPSGDLTAYIDTNGKLVVVDGFFTGSITGSTITGGTIKTAKTGNDRIEITGNGLTSYNESNQKEGVAIESGLYGFGELAIYVAGTKKGGFNAGQIDALFLETESGVDLIINPSSGSSNRITEYWNCAMARFAYLKDGSGNNYVTDEWAAQKGANTGSDSHSHTVTIGGVEYTTSSESHNHTQT